MTIQRYRNWDPLDPLPSSWTDAMEAALSVAEAQFVLRIKPSNATVLEVPASVGAGAAVVWIEGSPRWNETSVEYPSPGGGSVRNLDVWVVSTANAFAPGSPGEVDSTNYAFTLVIRETGVPPTGVAIKRLVGTAHWNGALFDTVTPTVGRPSPQTIGAAPVNDARFMSALRLSTTQALGTLAPGAVAYFSFAVPGAALGDLVVVGHNWLEFIAVSGTIVTANNVEVTAKNVSTGSTVIVAVPLAVNILVLKP